MINCNAVSIIPWIFYLEHHTPMPHAFKAIHINATEWVRLLVDPGINYQVIQIEQQLGSDSNWPLYWFSKAIFCACIGREINWLNEWFTRELDIHHTGKNDLDVFFFLMTLKNFRGRWLSQFWFICYFNVCLTILKENDNTGSKILIKIPKFTPVKSCF